MNGTERSQPNYSSHFVSKENLLWRGLICFFIYTSILSKAGSQESTNLCPWALGLGPEEVYELSSVNRIELELFVEAIKSPQLSWQRSPSLTTKNSSIKSALREELGKQLLKSDIRMKQGEKLQLPPKFDGVKFSTVFHLKMNATSKDLVELSLWNFNPQDQSFIQRSSSSIQLGSKTTVLRGLQAGTIEQSFVQFLSSDLNSQPPPLVRGILESLRLSQQGRRLSSSLRAQRRVDKRSQWLYLYLARIHSDERRTSEALIHWEQASYRGELDALNLSFYAEDLNRAARFIEAESFLRRALKKLSSNKDSALLSSLFERLNALSYRANQERELASQSAQAQRRIIELLKLQKDAETKSDEDPEFENLKERIKKNPQHLGLRRDLIHVLLKQGLFTQAIRELGAIKVTPENKSTIREIRAEILLRGSWPEKVIELFSGKNINPPSDQACILLGDAHLALSQATFRIQRWTEYSDTCFPRLEEYRDLEKPKESEQLTHWELAGLFYKQAKEIKPSSRAKCRWVEWQLINGNSDMSSLIETIFPLEDYPDSERVLSELKIKKGDQEQGLRLFMKFAFDQPKDLDTTIEFVDWILNSELEAPSGYFMVLLNIVQSGLEEEPFNNLAREWKVYLLLKLGRFAEAKDELHILLGSGRAGWEYLKSAWERYRIGPRATRPEMQVSRQIVNSSLPGSPKTFHDYLRLKHYLAEAMLRLDQPEQALLILDDLLEYFLIREQARLKWTRTKVTGREKEWTHLGSPKLEPVDFKSQRERLNWSKIDLSCGKALYQIGEPERAFFHVARAARRVAVRNGKVLNEREWGKELSSESLALVREALELILKHLPENEDSNPLKEWISELSQ